MWVEYGGSREKLLDLFAEVPPLTLDEIAGWWDPNAIEFSLCGEFLLEPTWLPGDKEVEPSDELT